uniref:Alcohol dehydrogenase N-terminal domain-containing protein n=1 Tax=Salix viminalis TaxID=40686 RepID=A0A6N2NLA2_SALVM
MMWFGCCILFIFVPQFSPAYCSIVEVPVPSAKKDEVLIKVEATSLNPYDLNIQKGVARPFLPRSFPYIPTNRSTPSMFMKLDFYLVEVD